MMGSPTRSLAHALDDAHPLNRAIDDMASWEGPATKWLRANAAAIEDIRRARLSDAERAGKMGE